MTEHSLDFVEAARAIASGRQPDLRALEASATDERSRDAIRVLDGLGRIASFHRDLHGLTDPARGDTSMPTWGSLSLVRELGRGSSGCVYLAFDPALGREVALKILERGGTSLEEGRHLARLRHPNIVQVHGAEAIDGQLGLEMEFVNGRTLADLVESLGPLGADEAMLIGRDVCRALAAIHAAGLVHRDVKAQNVVRERGGRTVLMDLGAGSPIEATSSVRLAGTPLYMAPEVLAGEPSTPRSDFYSVGVLLFYLVTRSFPVEAETLDELRGAHREGRRRELRDVRPGLPDRFIRAVNRALDPDPAGRFPSAGALEAELSSALGHAHPTSSPPRRQPLHFLGVAAAVLMTAAAGFWIAWPQSPPVVPVAARFVIPVEPYLTIPGGLASREFALSPDGTQLAYAEMPVGGSRIRIRPLNSAQARTLEGTGDAGRPFFSPDGRRIGFHLTTPSGGQLVTMALDAGAPSTVAEWPSAGGAVWAEGGTIVFSSQRDLWRVSEKGGNPVRLTTMSPGESALSPDLLPDGSVLFTHRTQYGAQSAIAVLSSSGQIRQLAEHATSAKYLPTGHVVFVTGDPPWIVVAPFDARRLTITGSPAQVQPLQSPAHWFDVSRTGVLVFSEPDEPPPAEEPSLEWIDRVTGRSVPFELPLRAGRFQAHSIRLSRDGRRAVVAVASSQLLETVDGPMPGPLLLGDLERGTIAPLVNEPVFALAWSRDDSRITYQKTDGSIAWRRVDGDGREELLAPAASERLCTSGEWSPDGRVMVLGCAGASGAENRRQWMYLSFATADAVGRSPVTPTPGSPSEPGAGAATFSPDGEWIAFSANLTGRAGGAALYVRPLNSPAPLTRITKASGRRPAWRGSEIIYLTGQGPSVIGIRTQPRLDFGEPQLLVEDFRGYDAQATGLTVFDVASDGRRILAMKRVNGRGGDRIKKLTVLTNWLGRATQK